MSTRICVPVTDDSYEDLTDNNTADFEIFEGSKPRAITDLLLLPAGGESSLQEGLDVGDGEEDITARTRC